MNIELREIKGITIAELVSDTTVLNTVQDAVDLIGNCGYLGANKVIVLEQHITPAFFDLKTKVAGDMLEKFSTYNMSLAIVGDFSKYTSNSLRDFIYESNKGRRVNFVGSVEEAREIFSS